jgi:hypothetical protein
MSLAEYVGSAAMASESAEKEPESQAEKYKMPAKHLFCRLD